MKTWSDRDGWLVTIGLKLVLEWAEECTSLKQLVNRIKEEIEKYERSP